MCLTQRAGSDVASHRLRHARAYQARHHGRANLARPRSPSARERLTVPLAGDQVVAVYSMTLVPRTAFHTLEGRLSSELLAQLEIALGARYDL